MSARTWNKGAPPHVGWWHASNNRAREAWRWWDGKQWGRVCYQNYSRDHAAQNAAEPAGNQYLIEWTTYYPRNARVPRVDPAKA